MKLYNITKSQLIILWVIGLVLSLYFFIKANDYGGEDWMLIVGLIIVGVMIFYTSGWRHFKKPSKKD